MFRDKNPFRIGMRDLCTLYRMCGPVHIWLYYRLGACRMGEGDIMTGCMLGIAISGASSDFCGMRCTDLLSS